MKRELLLRRFGIFMFLMEIKLNHNPENKPKLNTLQDLKWTNNITSTEVIRAFQQ